MATLKKLKEDRLSITSKILKKDEDFLPISPEFIKDLRDRTLFATPSMRLSFAQYDTMCKDEKVLNMMSITLNKPKAKLKKFCKYLSVFKKEIHLTPNKIAAKITEADTQDKPIFKLPKEIRSTILEKFAEILPSKYVLLDWIDKDKINWCWLSKNPNAIHLLENNLNKVDWDILSSNSNAIHILENNLNKVDWDILSSNPNAIHLLENNLNKVDWDALSSNPNAIHILENNLDKVDWDLLCYNPNAIHLLKNNQDKINWYRLSSNPAIFKDELKPL